MAFLRGVWAGWLAFGKGVGNFNTKIILGLVFVTVFGPGRLISLLVGKDFLERRDDGAESTWTTLEARERKIEDYQHLF